MAPGKILNFDLMRSIAILIILFHHLPSYAGNFYNLNYFGINLDLSELNEFNRYFGLGLFIFISGFLINLKNRNFLNRKTLNDFIQKRFLRIFPLYYLALAIFFYQHDVSDPLTMIAHIPGLQLIVASERIEPVRTLWFIGLITVYYAIFVMAHRGFYSKSILTKRLILCITIFFPAIVIFLNQSLGMIDIRLAHYYAIFWLGVYCANERFLEKFNKAVAFTLLPVFMLLYLTLIKNFYHADSIKYFDSISQLIIINITMFCFVLFIHAICDLVPTRIKSGYLVGMIAYSSYCMYLFHRPIWTVMRAIAQKIFMIESIKVLAVISIVLGIPMIIIFSRWLQGIYDKYCMKLFNTV